jgi:CheY-like chemotaxis protein
MLGLDQDVALVEADARVTEVIREAQLVEDVAGGGEELTLLAFVEWNQHVRSDGSALARGQCRRAAKLQSLAMPAAGGANPSVLVVEDDPVIRSVLVETLVDEGWEVREAQDGESALAELDRWRPSVIVLDLAMPTMDGWAFRAEQRRRGLAADVPLVIVSASREVEVRREELEPVAVLLKPFDLNDLIAAVHAAATA